MRLAGKRGPARGGAGGDSAIGTLFMLLVLTAVAFGATYSVLSGLYGRNAANVGDDHLKPAGDDSSAAGGGDGEAASSSSSSSSSLAVASDLTSGDFCFGQQHMELWGEAVKWGSSNLKDTPEECCKQCKDMCKSAAHCECNAWVYCGDAEKCHDNHRQCWLKKQEDVLKPEVHSFNLDVPWTSGIIHAPGKGIIALETKFGVIRIKLHSTWAPNTVSFVRELLQMRYCTGCEFYRAEGYGSVWKPDGSRTGQPSTGPPYALLQGTFQSDGVPFKPIKKEASPLVKRGHVCLVGEGPDFFISLGDHSDWGNAHTVFGEVAAEDLDIVVPQILNLPTKEETWNSVKVLALAEAVPFSLKRDESGLEL